jgi:hypothetical protein
MRQRPGARFVIDTLAAGPEQFVLRHSPADLCGPVARAVAAAAREVDSLHQTLMGQAAEAIRALGPVARGEDPDLPMVSGVLGATAHDIDLLAARRGTAHQHVVRLVTVYQQLTPAPAAAAVSARLDRRHGADDAVAGRSGIEAVGTDEHLLALRAVERGGLRFKQSAQSPTDRYLTDGTASSRRSRQPPSSR